MSNVRIAGMWSLPTKHQASAATALSGPSHGGVGWQAAEAKKVGGKPRPRNKVGDGEKERWRKTAVTFSAPTGGVVGCGVVAYTPADHFNPPPWSILGAWGGTQVEGKQQILEMKLAVARNHFYPLLLSVLE